MELSRAHLTPAGLAYVLVVTVLATVGFTTGTAWPILVAGALALPASIVLVPAYYVAYGLLALVPGANPSSSSGSGSSGPGGSRVFTTGDPAAWFGPVTSALGIAALVVAAVLNVVVVRAYLARRRAD